jgi:hypothetical protein
MILFVLMWAGSEFNIPVAREAAKNIHDEATMTARGAFDVKVTPQPPDDAAGGPFGRLFLEKRFHGELEGVSHGQMPGTQTAVTGSAAYVALELVTGTLHGKRGTFILQHKGTMHQGAYVMDVVPNAPRIRLLRLLDSRRVEP